MRKTAIVSWATAALLVVANAAPSLGCGGTSGNIGPPLAFVTSPGSGLQPASMGNPQSLLSIQVDLFPPQTTTTCTCGIGLGGGGSPPPVSLSVDQVFVTRMNLATGQHTVLGEFAPLATNSVTTAALGNGLGQLFPGATWFGFSGKIEPFMPPLLGPDEIFTFSFVLSFSEEDASRLPSLPVQFAAGVGEEGGLPVFANVPHAVRYVGVDPLPPCIPTDTALCLNENRFRVEVIWEDFVGNTAAGRVIGCSAEDSGLFYFFNPENWELQVKVLDACPGFGHFWVFFAGTTNVEFMLQVTDTQTGIQRQYFNPLGQLAGTVADTTAFATCP